jgi:hypothetical protein
MRLGRSAMTYHQTLIEAAFLSRSQRLAHWSDSPP